MKVRPVIATTNGAARRCWIAPMPIATPAMIVASSRPIRWIAGSSRMPPPSPRPATMTMPSTQCTAHRLDRIMPARSRRPRIVGKVRPMTSIYVTLYRFATLSRAHRHGLRFAGAGRRGAAMVAQAGISKGTASRERRARPLTLARWLLAVAALIVLIVAVGGITRLTESGLSITEWKPVTGAIPPLSEAQWRSEFAAYQRIGEYRQITGPAGMTLADYKFIYFWEWLHRLLGRLIGLAFALPLAWFWARGAIPAGYKPRLVGLLALGGLQGLLGWLMVRSGLSGEVTDVSHFWLSAHLLTALLTLALLVWTALDMLALHRDPAARPARM